jgi:phytoene dehydrogenase-like protein
VALRGLDVTQGSRRHPLFTMSVGDLLREWFESEAVQAMMAVNGVIGTWAGPEEPGTAYVMLHHSIGDVGAGSALGHGATRAVAWAPWPTPSVERPSPTVPSCGRRPGRAVLTRGGQVTGVALADGEELATDVVVTAVHPQIGFLAPPRRRRAARRLRRRIRRWRSRSGTVKVNLALSELPDFASHPGTHCSPTTRAPSSWPTRSTTSRPRSRTPGAGGRARPVQRRVHPLDVRPRRCAPRAPTS